MKVLRVVPQEKPEETGDRPETGRPTPLFLPALPCPNQNPRNDTIDLDIQTVQGRNRICLNCDSMWTQDH